jgi:formylglycine-generating enzyme required for sulfatase activity/tRNA A-37 threonylcarbamoyl transferase component Bud32
MMPERIGGYQVLRTIASGGMGVVYEAVQAHTRRRVAIKVLRRSMASKTSIKRFEHEAQMLARLDHPHIAQVIEAGTYVPRDGLPGEEADTPYYVMEYVPGARPITHHAREKDLTVRERLALFLQACDGVHLGHQKGIIHRDLKPGNLLVDDAGQVKIIDFGVARAIDTDVTIATQLTEVGQLIGTMQYMSPEQCKADPHDLDMRSDVYALGVVLYELLCDELPYDVAQSPVFEAARVIYETDPRRPSAMKQLLRGDLETIVLKALEKDRANRYQDVAAFAADLRHYLRGEVIQARPAGPVRRLGKWVRRNPGLSVAGSAAALAVAGFLGYLLLWSYPRLQEAYGRIIRLSDVAQLSILEERAEHLWPALPANIPRMKAWIEDAEQVVARLDDHRLVLAALRERTVSGGTAAARSGPASQGAWIFDDVETQWQHDTLAGLVSRLEALNDPGQSALGSVRQRLEFASTIRQLSIDDHREEWDRAIASIADPDECPLYGGLRITPQLGLVPVGRDPASGLWEFVHLQTGVIPHRDEHGALRLTEEMGLVFVLIPGGTFRMGARRPSPEHPLGSPNVDPNSLPVEGPVHEVTVPPYLLSKYEMTQGQWLRTTGENPSYYDDRGEERYRPKWNRNGDPHSYLLPVSDVSWERCVEVLDRLGLRLPSEAEWEYAARAGTSTVYWSGNEKESLRGAANIQDLFYEQHSGLHLQHPHENWLDDGHVVGAPVGTYRPNPFGLHDTSGNMLEWCQDSFHSYEVAPGDGSAFETPEVETRILRGGDWVHFAGRCRSSDRHWRPPSYREKDVGLRPAAALQVSVAP